MSYYPLLLGMMIAVGVFYAVVIIGAMHILCKEPERGHHEPIQHR